MNICGTCKYFGPEIKGSDDDEDVGDSLNIPRGYHRCMLIERTAPGHIATEVAVVVDASGYYAALCVKEEFGCNQWKEAYCERCDGSGCTAEGKDCPNCAGSGRLAPIVGRSAAAE